MKPLGKGSEVLADVDAINQARLAVRRSFRLFAATCLKIRTKSGEIKPFVLNEAQLLLLDALNEQLREYGYVRIVILKGRQMGISTFIEAFLYWLTSTRPGKRAVVVAHKDEATRSLFSMTKRFHQLNNPEIKPHTSASSKRELDFDILQSSYLVVTAGGDEIGRSETLQYAHLSEVAFWPKGSAEPNFTALMQCIPMAGSPEARGTVAFSESTANGMSGVFYSQWKNAEAGNSEWMPLFLPWTIMPEYTAPVPDDFEKSQEEIDLVKKYGLTDGQLMFRRIKIANSGPDKFKQEYPLCPDEAFLTTGCPVFPPQIVSDILKRDYNPHFKMKAFNGTAFSEVGRGDLLVWKEPEKGTQYFIGADVGAGIPGRDYSVAVVMDDNREVVALYKGYPIPETYAEILNCLGLMYNEARLIVENNNHGILPCSILGRQLMYPNLYTEEVLNTTDMTMRTQIGWRTNPKSKPLIIDELRAVIVEKSIHIPTSIITRELNTFVVDESGKMAADKGRDENGEVFHDDCVMALALANHICEERYEPITVTDDFYTGEVMEDGQNIEYLDL